MKGQLHVSLFVVRVSQYVIGLILCVVHVTTARDTGGESVSSRLLKSIGDEYWMWRMREFPLWATYRGIHDYDDRLEEYTEEAFLRRKLECTSMLSRLEAVNGVELTHKQRIDLEVLRADLSYFINGYDWRKYGNLNPLNLMEGMHRSHGWVKSMLYYREEDFRTYLTRIRAFATQVDQIISLMREAILLNRTNHESSMIGVVEVLDDQINVPANESVYFWPFGEMMVQSEVDSETRESLKMEALEIIEMVVQDAYRRLKSFLQSEYLPNTRPHEGVGSMVNGYEYYNACLRFHLTLNMTAQEVRDIGLREVARIKGQMEQIMREENFHGTLPEFFELLQTERRDEFYGQTDDELLEGYRHIIYNRINPKLPSAFDQKYIPSTQISVEPMDHDGPSGSYGGNTFYANLRRPETRPSFLMMALSLHEANPGHHLQTAYTRDHPSPDFRRYLYASKYYAVPYNLPFYTGYVEGWGLYAEYLGEEMGLYNTSKLELFGRYSSEIFRACRLVIDTGIHAFGMTRQEGIDYLANHSATPRSQIETEISRYITWPGQATAYKIGEILLLRMRRRAEETLGDRFDIREFHGVILKIGRAPLSLVEREINRWIAEKTVQALSSNTAFSLHHSPTWGAFVTCALLWTTLLILNFTDLFKLTRL